jgi:ribose/xylose/arabinose/galactoside ABC-type transport system permease subunit
MSAEAAVSRLAPGRVPRIAAALERNGIFVLLAAVVAAGAAVAPELFGEFNIRNLLLQASILGILALAQFLVVLIGGFDLSVAAVMALGSVIAVSLAPVSLPLALLAAMAAGLGIGAINGLSVTVGRVTPLIATLATMGIARGLAFQVTEKSLLAPPGTLAPFHGSLSIVTAPLVFWIALTVVVAFVLGRTRVGRHLYAIGGNERVARLAGIRVARLKVGVYAMAGLLSGVAGFAFVLRSSSGVPHLGAGWELDTIAAIVIGGARLFGGDGSVVKAMAGVLVYQLMSNVMNLSGLDPYYQDITKALIVVGAVGLGVLRARRGRHT